MKKETQKTKGKSPLIFAILVSILTVVLIIPEIIAPDPPFPQGISGYIVNPNGEQMPLSTKYTINDTLSGYFKQSQTSNPVPGFSGYYSETITGAKDDPVIIFAWNASSYGAKNVTLSGLMSGINVTVNISRDPEPIVNITLPLDNTLRNDSVYFTVSSNITLYGNSAGNCIAQISYSNQSVLKSYNNQPTSINLGSLGLGYSSLINWNISGYNVGSSNITVNFTCDGMLGTKFEVLNFTDTLLNITVADKTSPNITLLGPQDMTKTNNATQLFQYNVTDTSSIKNCSLYINKTYKQSNLTPQKNITLWFIETLTSGNNIWYILCYDYYNISGASKNFTIILDNLNRTVVSDKTEYKQGDTARFTGYNWTNNSVVTIELTQPDFSKKYWNTTINNLLNTTCWINYSNQEGTYSILGYEYNYTYYNASASFNVNQRIQTMATDKQQYNFYENLTLNSFNFSMNATVRLTIFQNSTGAFGPGFPKTVKANSSGNFAYYWNVTDTCTGVYGILAEDLNYTPYNLTVYFNISGGEPCSNWGNTPPNISLISVDDGISPTPNEVYLLAGQKTSIHCNITAKDVDGFSDITSANATFYFYQNRQSDPDNNNNHYTNSSCINIGDNGVDTKYFFCGFDIQYYSNNGTWQCNASVYDAQNAKASSNQSVKIHELFALNITPMIDFGNLATGDYSSEIGTTVTNLGNVRMDVGIDAYGTNDGDGIAMNCSTKSNISFNDERYSTTSGTAFASMSAVSDSITTLTTFDLSKQTTGALAQKDIYWKLRATPLSLGDCQGVVVVTAK